MRFTTRRYHAELDFDDEDDYQRFLVWLYKIAHITKPKLLEDKLPEGYGLQGTVGENTSNITTVKVGE